jgi:RHS repeat-associated protein
VYYKYRLHINNNRLIVCKVGKAEQHIQYAPFGELTVSQLNSTFDSRYKFTAKEHDTETNYTYFGARYYDSDASIWLSVDPMADKAPNWSPYNYCWDNPINTIDRYGLWGEKKAHRKQERAASRVEKRGGYVTPVYKDNDIGEWGFKVSWHSYKEAGTVENGEPTITAYAGGEFIYENSRFKAWASFSFSRSKVGEALNKADIFAKDYLAPTIAKIHPASAPVDGFKTLFTGIDLNETKQEGAFNRVISPLISIATPFVSGLNAIGAINLSAKTAKTMDAIGTTNTVINGSQEGIRLYNEKHIIDE